MNKKLFTLIFVVISTLANIIWTLLLIAAIYAIAFCTMKYGIKLEAGHQAYGMSLLFSFVAGLVVSFITYTKIQTKVITSFNFENKFEDAWLKKKEMNTSSNVAASENSTEETKTTVLPSSVLPTDEEKEEQEKWGDN